MDVFPYKQLRTSKIKTRSVDIIVWNIYGKH